MLPATTPNQQDREWAINVRTLQAPQSGVQRYLRELDSRFAPDLPRIKPSFPLQGPLGHLWEQVIVPFCSRDRLLFSPGNTGPLLRRLQVVTIHDASTFDCAEAFTGSFGRWYRWLLPRLARKCLGVITVSEFSRGRLAATLGIDLIRIAVVYNGVTPPPVSATPAAIESVRARLHLPRKFLLFVGSRDPRKNVSLLLRAFAVADRGGLELVLAGGGNSRLFSESTSPGVRDGVRDLGHVTDDVLEALYALADAFVFPSLYEGFGLPPLEAMARGCPVLCSDASCLPEICGPSFDLGGAPIYFSPYDVSSLSAAIRRLVRMTDEEKGRMRRAGLNWSSAFTWDRCAAQTLLALRGFAAREKGRLPPCFQWRELGKTGKFASVTGPANFMPSNLPAHRKVSALSLGDTTIVHHWMEFFRGGEAVLEQFGLLFPDAPIFMLVYNEAYLPPSLQAHPLYSSFLQRLPILKRHFRKLLPVFPRIIRSQRIPGRARFVLTSDASMIKGIRIPSGASHVCYCHSPPRYLWGLEESYLESSSHGNPFGRFVFSASLPHLRSFDRKMAQKVDGFIANSVCVQERIRRCYDRDSVVINPPVEVDRFDPTLPREDFYLIVSALVPYKRVDLAVDACSKLGRKLIVIGTGPEEADLRRRAATCVTFMGWQSNDIVRSKYETCRALLFPGIEDFGITPCEAQAAGAPVIAFGEGGALETVREGVSGFFFREQTVASLIEAIEKLESSPGLTAAACAANVANLDPARFRREIKDYLRGAFPDLFSDFEWPEGLFSA